MGKTGDNKNDVMSSILQTKVEWDARTVRSSCRRTVATTQPSNVDSVLDTCIDNLELEQQIENETVQPMQPSVANTSTPGAHRIRGDGRNNSNHSLDSLLNDSAAANHEVIMAELVDEEAELELQREVQVLREKEVELNELRKKVENTIHAEKVEIMKNPAKIPAKKKTFQKTLCGIIILFPYVLLFSG